MSKLPPVEKFPLAVRKNIRDEWEAKKEDVERQLSELLGVPWTVDVDLKQVYAYAHEGYALERLGSCVYEHFDSNVRILKIFTNHYEEDGINEINSIAFKHVLVLDVDTKDRVQYSGCDVADGRLCIVFNPKRIDSNIGHAFEEKEVLQALKNADPPENSKPTLNALVRLGISRDYNPQIESVRKEVAEILDCPEVKFNPNFQANYEKLLVESQRKGNKLEKDWDALLGGWTLSYFQGLPSSLKLEKFDDDEMIREALNEAVTSGEYHLRVVDKLKKSYCEWVIEDGIFYMQCLPTTWGSAMDQASRDIVDGL